MFAVLLAAVAAGQPPAAPTTRTVATTVRQGVLPPPGVQVVVGPTGSPPGTPATPAPVMPNNGAPIKYQQACPGEVPQPFQRQAKVTPVGACQTDGTVGAGATSSQVWAVEFDEAAHIPLPRFDQERKPVCDTDGLVIYEGMRLTVDAGTGTYDVAFTATVPGCLTVLRLQLEFDPVLPAAIPPVPLVSPKSYKLTLPPIRLEPAANSRRGDTDADTFHIHHRGYSSIFLAKQDEWKPGGRSDIPSARLPVAREGWTVRRAAVARFGTPVAVEEVSR